METLSKPIVLRYCPVVKHNVVVEVNFGEDCCVKNNAASANCLNAHKCLKDRGGCTNRLLSCSV